MASVPLPKKTNNNNSTDPQRPPVWSITSTASSAGPPPLALKCARHQNSRRGVCCKELKTEQRKLIDSDVMRDIVIGLSDGLTVPYLCLAGLASLGSSRVVVLGGVAELIAGGISMGIGAFLATQAERDSYIFLEQQTAHRVSQSCAGELEREVDEILGPLGVPTELSRQVANTLHREEANALLAEGAAAPANGDTVENGYAVPAPGEERLKFSSTVGLTPFLLRFGMGVEPVPTSRMYSSAATIGVGYLIGGIIPLLPYFFIPVVNRALFASCILTFVVLILFGVLKAHITGAGTGWRGYLWGAVSTAMVGGMAAGAAFGLVRLLEGHD
ncbi:related to CCC1 protein (involved in calcium homeostasis) [Serendipita indica DSM 11827]|uniref:Related to CCC1 protein (Involved in calcium homeostasis) n=1 Tax=Serendipita indica (strain DSM 11827) TaxID=1109443 RepID=G4TWY2_SERID|nr:related to CCC1 protein (involved in calcium homeostasis) [Serendipita indica DSM 11827]